MKKLILIGDNIYYNDFTCLTLNTCMRVQDVNIIYIKMSAFVGSYI